MIESHRQRCDRYTAEKDRIYGRIFKCIGAAWALTGIFSLIGMLIN